jgi:hypothetical protein
MDQARLTSASVTANLTLGAGVQLGRRGACVAGRPHCREQHARCAHVDRPGGAAACCAYNAV